MRRRCTMRQLRVACDGVLVVERRPIHDGNGKANAVGHGRAQGVPNAKVLLVSSATRKYAVATVTVARPGGP